MKQPQVVEHLAALLEAKVLTPMQVINAAYTAGWGEADRTHDQRKQEHLLATQSLGNKS